MGRVAILLAFAAVVSAALDASAGSVVVFETRGPKGDQLTTTIIDVLSTELSGHDVTRQPGIRSVKAVHVRAAPKITKAVAAAGADVGVATAVNKRRRKVFLAVVAVSAGGTVVFDKTVRLPKKNPQKKVAGLMRQMASAIADELRRTNAVAAESQPSPEPAREAPMSPAPTTASSSPTAADGGGGSAGGGAVGSDETPVESSSPSPFGSPPPMLAAAGDDEPAADLSRRRKRRREGGFHAAARAGAGGLFFQDDLVTAVKGGQLAVDAGLTLLITAGVEMTYDDWLTFNASFRRYGAIIGHQYDGDNPSTSVEEPSVEPKEIDCSALGGTALLGAGMDVGDFIGGVTAGISYDSFSATAQTQTTSTVTDDVIVLVPSWKRLAAVAGFTLSYGRLASEGFGAQLGVLAVPWGSYAESPRTSGASSRVIGVQSWLGGRYVLADLLGNAGGLFIEARADFEYLNIQFKGEGTRLAVGSGNPVQASKETRLAVGAGLSLGYVY